MLLENKTTPRFKPSGYFTVHPYSWYTTRVTVAHAQIHEFLTPLFHISTLIHWYILLALTKNIFRLWEFLTSSILLSHQIPSLLYSQPSNDCVSASERKFSWPAGSYVIYPWAISLTSSLTFSLPHYSQVIFLQIFAFPKYSKCGPSPRAFVLAVSSAHSFNKSLLKFSDLKKLFQISH